MKTETAKSKRPLKVDEASYDKLTIARMTDHNVTPVEVENDDDQRTEAVILPDPDAGKAA